MILRVSANWKQRRESGLCGTLFYTIMTGSRLSARRSRLRRCRCCGRSDIVLIHKGACSDVLTDTPSSDQKTSVVASQHWIAQSTLFNPKLTGFQPSSWSACGLSTERIMTQCAMKPRPLHLQSIGRLRQRGPLRVSQACDRTSEKCCNGQIA